MDHHLCALARIWVWLLGILLDQPAARSTSASRLPTRTKIGSGSRLPRWNLLFTSMSNIRLGFFFFFCMASCRQTLRYPNKFELSLCVLFSFFLTSLLWRPWQGKWPYTHHSSLMLITSVCVIVRKITQTFVNRLRWNFRNRWKWAKEHLDD